MNATFRGGSIWVACDRRGILLLEIFGPSKKNLYLLVDVSLTSEVP